MVGSQGKLSDAVKGRPVDNRRTDGVGLNLLGTFDVGKNLVESWNRSYLEQAKQIPGEIMCDVIAILVGRRLEKTDCSVDKTNNVVNVFACMLFDVQVPNLEEGQIQCGLRAVLEAIKNQMQHQRPSLAFDWSTQVFFVASIPEVCIHIVLEGHLHKGHVLLDIRFINPSIEPLETQDDLILSQIRKLSNRLKCLGPRAGELRQSTG